MVALILWAIVGAAFGLFSAWLLWKMLTPVLRGEGGIGAVLIGAAPLMHFVLLLIAALFDKEALLFAGIGDAAGTLGLGILLFIRGRKK